MGERAGYEYYYKFWVEDNVIPLYQLCVSTIKPDKGYLFEIRTNFKLKDRFSMGSERFGVAVRGHDEERLLTEQTSFRLKDYWMSDDEIQSLVRDAVDFARKQRAAAAETTVIAVVVGIDVCTVIKQEEDINVAVNRAIRPKYLIPISVWPVVPDWMMEEARESEKFYRKRLNLLRDLPRVRVENAEGLGLMRVCHVCWRKTITGALISFIPNCNHACHSHCLFDWLSTRNSLCPSCFARIPSDSERDLNSDSALEDALSSDSDFEDDSFISDSDDSFSSDSADSDYLLRRDELDKDSVLDDLVRRDSDESDFDDLMSSASHSLDAFYPLDSESDSDSLFCNRGVSPCYSRSDSDSFGSDSLSDTSTSSSDSGNFHDVH